MKLMYVKYWTLSLVIVKQSISRRSLQDSPPWPYNIQSCDSRISWSTEQHIVMAGLDLDLDSSIQKEKKRKGKLPYKLLISSLANFFALLDGEHNRKRKTWPRLTSSIPTSSSKKPPILFYWWHVNTESDQSDLEMVPWGWHWDGMLKVIVKIEL